MKVDDYWNSIPLLEELAEKEPQIRALGDKMFKMLLQSEKNKIIDEHVCNFLRTVLTIVGDRGLNDELRDEIYWFSYSFVENESDDIWRISNKTKSAFAGILNGYGVDRILKELDE